MFSRWTGTIFGSGEHGTSHAQLQARPGSHRTWSEAGPPAVVLSVWQRASQDHNTVLVSLPYGLDYLLSQALTSRRSRMSACPIAQSIPPVAEASRSLLATLSLYGAATRALSTTISTTWRSGNELTKLRLNFRLWVAILSTIRFEFRHTTASTERYANNCSIYDNVMPA